MATPHDETPPVEDDEPLRKLEATIRQKKVTYDFERQMEGAKKVKTSEFAGHMIENMEALKPGAKREAALV